VTDIAVLFERSSDHFSCHWSTVFGGMDWVCV